MQRKQAMQPTNRHTFEFHDHMNTSGHARRRRWCGDVVGVCVWWCASACVGGCVFPDGTERRVTPLTANAARARMRPLARAPSTPVPGATRTCVIHRLSHRRWCMHVTTPTKRGSRPQPRRHHRQPPRAPPFQVQDKRHGRARTGSPEHANNFAPAHMRANQLPIF